MPQSRLVAFGTLVLLATAAAAAAQSPQSSSRFLHPQEIAPFVTSAGDAPGVGLAVRWPIASRITVQAEGEYRHGDHDLRRYLPGSTGFNGNVVLVLDLPGVGRITPFIVGGGGLEHHTAAEWAPSLDLVQWQGADSFVVNAGGGVRVGLTDRVGVRIEVRYADGWADGAVDSIRVMYGTTVAFGRR